MNVPDAALLAVAGLAAGTSNSIAGGGTLISFPALLAVGHPVLSANVTNTVSVWPGYLSGAAAYRPELKGQRVRVKSLAPTAAAGGVIGTILLLTAPPGLFKALVPFLVLSAVVLLGLQPRLSAWVQGRKREAITHRSLGLHAATFAGGVYGAYFGGGLGVILLGVLAVFLDDQLQRLNGLRSVLSLVINTVALAGFVIFAPVAWSAVAVIAPASLLGGVVGANLARRLNANFLRYTVMAFGAAVAARLFLA
jgi:uncharacterized membrane protein YfcA